MNPDTLCHMRRYFDSRAAAWDRNTPAHQASIQRILSLFAIPPERKVLDIGCGTGVLFDGLRALSPRQVLAVDVSPAMVEIAAQKAAGSCIRVEVCDFYALTEGGFDLAVAYNAYPHFMDKRLFLQTARRVLAPGGRLIVAHGAGRGVINGRHCREDVVSLSSPLEDGRTEAAAWTEGGLHVDTVVDMDHVFILSGVNSP